ncbi:MAG: HAD family hydrolase [Chloroflexi bacterium]|nr:HAD family hydrolase [Chloroflexota bacterium]
MPFVHLPEGSRFLRPATERQAGAAAVFLDRDGVLLADVHFLRRPAQLRVLPGVPEAVRALQEHFALVVVTNQSGIARGLFGEEELLAIHAELARRLAIEGGVLDALYFCPHLPEGTVPAYRMDCECRKPKPGMLVRAACEWQLDLARSFMVGDAWRDVAAGRAAGVHSILLGSGEFQGTGAIAVAADLAQAARLILARRNGQSGLAGSVGRRG